MRTSALRLHRCGNLKVPRTCHLVKRIFIHEFLHIHSTLYTHTHTHTQFAQLSITDNRREQLPPLSRGKRRIIQTSILRNTNANRILSDTISSYLYRSHLPHCHVFAHMCTLHSTQSLSTQTILTAHNL